MQIIRMHLNGHIKVVKYLYTLNVNIHANNKVAFRYLLNISTHTINKTIFRYACHNGHIEVAMTIFIKRRYAYKNE